jgi:Tol biopolymer transport system component
VRVRRGTPLVALAALTVVTAAAGAEASRRVSTAIVIGNDAPAWSPDGNRIAFTAFRHGNGEIYVMRADGRGQTRLTRTTAHEDHAAWSPDGTRIAFASTRNGNYEIYVMNADGSNQRRLTNEPRNDYLPTWSPDGRSIAWQSDRGGDYDIYAMDASGGNVRRLTTSSWADTSPSWSSDGRIAFASRVGGTYNIHVMDRDGSDVRAVTSGNTNKDRPAWSPDAKRILYVSEQNLPLGNTEIYVVDAAGGVPTRLTNFSGRDDWPAWSPDGTRFAFARGITYRSPEIFVASLDDTAITRLTRTPSRLVIVDAYAPPPLAGRRWSILALAEDITDQPLRATTAVCRATLGGKPFAVTSRGAEGGTVRCTWALPRNARGKTIKGTVGIRSRSLRAETPFSLRVG